MDIFEVDSWEDIEDAIDAGDMVITSMIFTKIKKGITRNFKKVKVFSFIIATEPEYKYDWYLENAQYKKALLSCLDAFEEEEMFEECSEIMNLISKYETKKQSIK